MKVEKTVKICIEGDHSTPVNRLLGIDDNRGAEIADDVEQIFSECTVVDFSEKPVSIVFNTPRILERLISKYDDNELLFAVMYFQYLRGAVKGAFENIFKGR